MAEDLPVPAPRQTVAVVGASSDRSKYGNKSVRAHQQQGWNVFPVNPKGGTIEGQTVWTTVASIPVERLDRISVYVPPSVTLALLDDFATKKPREIWLNPGSESPEVVARAEALGLPVIQACSIVDIGRMPDEFDSASS